MGRNLTGQEHAVQLKQDAAPGQLVQSRRRRGGEGFEEPSLRFAAEWRHFLCAMTKGSDLEVKNI